MRKTRWCAKGWRVRGRRGGVLVEVAFVSFLLVILVLGMVSVAVQNTVLEHQGRLPGELADHGKWLLEEVGVWDAAGAAALETLAFDRMPVGAGDLGVAIHHVGRHPVTGVYAIHDTLIVGGLPFTPALSLVNAPDPSPGLHALGQVLELDLGEEAVVVEARSVFDAVPRGVGPLSSRTTWAVAPLDPIP